ncbi:MAG: methyl-accepting chemotaxis protein [Candidatus Zhuqueibacterota bacterium]
MNEYLMLFFVLLISYGLLTVAVNRIYKWRLITKFTVATLPAVGITVMLSYMFGRSQLNWWNGPTLPLLGVSCWMLAIWIMVRNISIPLQKIKDAAQRAADGDLNVQLHIQGNDESSELADAFNRMAENIRGMMEVERRMRNELEETVKRYVDFVAEVGKGKLDIKLDVTASNNMGILGEHLNQMVLKLRDYTAEIEQSGSVERKNKEKLQFTIEEYLRFIERVSKGDLRGRIELTGINGLSEMGSYLNNMVSNLKELALQNQLAADELARATSEITSAASEQVSSANEQMASVNETSTSVDQLKQSVQQSADRAMMVSDLAKKSTEISENGRSAVEKTVDSMEKIKEQMEIINETILNLSEQSQQIGDIITSVNEIAEQSNLLALNAAIEAARAGEHGKGFSVVAAEVKNLADQSKEATIQIRSILSDIQKNSERAVLVTDKGSHLAQEGVEMVHQAGATIQHLAETISQSAQVTLQIVSSSGQQARGIDQISIAMEQINQATNQNVVSVSQMEKAAENLNQLGMRLHDLVKMYQIG